MKKYLLFIAIALFSCSPKQSLVSTRQKIIHDNCYLLKLFGKDISSDAIEKLLPDCAIETELMKGSLQYSDKRKGLIILERNNKCWRIFIEKTSKGFHFDLPYEVKNTVTPEKLIKNLPGFIYDHKVDEKRWADFESKEYTYSYYFENNILKQVRIESKLNAE